MKHRRLISLFTLCVLALAQSLRAADITVFAAASLSDALEEITRDYKHNDPAGNADRIFFNFAASSTLSRQIREGAPADIFISADEAQMDTLASRNLLAPNTRRILLTNTLVIVIPANSTAAISDAHDLLAPTIRRLALGEPATVPAGVYARTWLARLDLWEKLAASGKIVPCENVRAALAAVESGNADAAIVYATDALSTAKVRIALKIAGPEAPKITYPVAIIKTTRQTETAQRFYDYLTTTAATAIFQKHGFGTQE